MRTVQDLPEPERRALAELRRRIQQEFPDWSLRMILFGLSLLTLDRRLRAERGDFSVFQNIREEGIPA